MSKGDAVALTIIAFHVGLFILAAIGAGGANP